MNTVYLLRHAKSDRSGFSGKDHDRPLNERGRRTAGRIGRFLVSNGIRPDHVICSTAQRTRETLELVQEAADWHTPDVKYERRVYLTSAETVFGVLRESDSDTHSVLVVGHEPTMEALTSMLIGGGHIRFPTAALARIDSYATNWESLRPGAGSLIFHVIPALLADF